MSILSTIEAYKALNIHQVIDHEKFSQYAIVHHSSSIEGSTLTLIETQLLLDEGITPKGKPLLHSLMVKDHYDGLIFTLRMVENRTPVTTELIQTINAQVMKNTGSVYQTVLGSIDATKGKFRKGNVQAGNSYFVNYDKVIPYTNVLAEKIQAQMKLPMDIEQQLELSFSAHFDLVTIHPFYDGNGRTSRLLMNFIQQYYGLPLGIVFTEDKVDYYNALQESRKKESKNSFYEFMLAQYEKHLNIEIAAYEKMIQGENLKPNSGKEKGFSLFF